MPRSCDDVAAVVKGASVVIGDRRVLGPVDLAIERCEHWALLGPNGAGKTTLLSLLGAERHPSAGTVTVLGQTLGHADLRAIRRHIGVIGHRVADRVPKHLSAIEIVLTGRDNVLAPWWSEFSSTERRVALDLLDRVGCALLYDQAFGRCSQGERQRVLLARSLFGRHELLLLDEPALGMDFPGREALIIALDDLASDVDGPTTVHVVHALEELPASTTHAALLRDGIFVASGGASDVLRAGPLEECFAMPFVVTRSAGRYSARAKAV